MFKTLIISMLTDKKQCVKMSRGECGYARAFLCPPCATSTTAKNTNHDSILEGLASLQHQLAEVKAMIVKQKTVRKPKTEASARNSNKTTSISELKSQKNYQSWAKNMASNLMKRYSTNPEQNNKHWEKVEREIQLKKPVVNEAAGARSNADSKVQPSAAPKRRIQPIPVVK